MNMQALTLSHEDATLSAADFAAVSRLAYQYAGIDLPDSKRTLVASRLAKLVRAKGCTLTQYITEAGNIPSTRQDLIQALTTNHTRFFREPHHFEHFVKVARPEIMKSVQQRQSVRLWSAGSSSGEEVYTLAMSLLGPSTAEAGLISNSDTAMLATDINHEMLKIGRAARYDQKSLREIPANLAQLWTRDAGPQFEMVEQARAMVRFRHLNLIADWPIQSQFNVIFCRNTMIYFDGPTSEKLQCRLADHLRPGGYLYIGHSERLIGDATKKLENVGQTIFRKPLP
jgi:chemotaxis protein methyltransferase CheR